MSKNSKLKVRKKADPGTATFDLITFMNEAIEAAGASPEDGDDTHAAAIIAKQRLENIGADRLLWEEHALSWCVALFTTFMIYNPDQKPVVQPEGAKGRETIPGGVRGSFDDPDTDGETDPDIDPDSDPDIEKTKFVTQPDAPTVTGAAAHKYFTHVKRSIAKALYYLSHDEIAANLAVRMKNLTGKNHIAAEWKRLLDKVPPGMCVYQCLTPEELETFDLRGDFDTE